MKQLSVTICHDVAALQRAIEYAIADVQRESGQPADAIYREGDDAWTVRLFEGTLSDGAHIYNLEIA